MGLFFNTIFLDVLSIIVTLLCALVTYIIYSLTYWSRRKCPYISSQFPFGNTTDVFLQRCSFGECLKSFYTDFKSKGHRFGGFYILTNPHLLIVDPELVKNILTRDFSYFPERIFRVNEEKEPLLANMLYLPEHKWKNLRHKLSPALTTGKMKMMFQMMLTSADALEGLMDEFVKNKEDINIKEVIVRFITDLIGSCAFGLECNSIKNKDTEFYKHSLRIFTPTIIESYGRALAKIFPKLFYFFQFRLLDKNTNKFFNKVVADTIDYREKKNVKRNDFLQLLINIKNTGDVDLEANSSVNSSIKEENRSVNVQGLTLEEITAQCFVFLMAGSETSSTTMSIFLYYMSVHQEIQNKVRKEVNDMLKKYEGKLTYEGIKELHYIEQAIFESIRLHPSVPFIDRFCTKDYQIPDSDVIIEKGTKIYIPLIGFQSDPEYYPEPTKYDPDRFSKEEYAKRHPSVFLPFGDGPRYCMGQKFGLLQVKVGLVALLKKYRFSLSKKTQLPLKIDPKCIFLKIVGDIWLNAERI